MIRFYLQKLVRDKVVKKCLDDEEVLHTEYRELNKQEFRRELLRKVHEEADEIPLDDNQRGESLKELADLQEVVDALRQDFGFSTEQVQEEMSFIKAAFILLFTRHFLLNLLYRKAKRLAQRVNDFLQISQLFERFITLFITQRNLVCLLVDLTD